MRIGFVWPVLLWNCGQDKHDGISFSSLAVILEFSRMLPVIFEIDVRYISLIFILMKWSMLHVYVDAVPICRIPVNP